jgi:hypothetical protein
MMIIGWWRLHSNLSGLYARRGASLFNVYRRRIAVRALGAYL